MASLALRPVIVPRKAQFGPRAWQKPERESKIDWKSPRMRGVRLTHAAASCTTCHGSGLTLGRGFRPRACDCVLRRIFRVVMARRLYRKTYASSIPVCQLADPAPTAQRRSSVWGFKLEEFCADVDCLARETLSDSDLRIHQLRNLEHLEAAEIARILHLDRGTVFHRIYAIEAALGAKFIALSPYPLYPVDEYFGATLKRHQFEDLEQAA